MKSYIGRAVVTVAACMSIPTVAFAAQTQVKSGDTLWSIAEQYHVSVNALEEANGLHTSTIHPGQVLQIPGSSSKSSARATTTGDSIVIVTVRSGDTVSGIASRYGATVSSTLSLNGLTSKSILHIGEKLKVYTGYTGAHSSRGESAPAGLGAAVQALNMIDFAKRFLGVPYVWGGESPRGFDCSGFVQFVYGHFGIHVGRTSYTQYREGSAAPSHYPNVGDLVFFDTDGAGASHVGIYIGNGEFINAEDRGVRIDSLSSSYWSSHYIGAKHF